MREFLKQTEIRRILRYILYLFLALVAQNMAFTQLRPLGVCPLILPAAAVAVGMFEGAGQGAFFSLVMGIFADMAFVENTVLFTILFPALAFFSGFMAKYFVNKKFFAFMGLAFAAAFATAAVQMLVTAVRDAWSASMIPTVLLQTLWSLPVSALAYFMPAKWNEE